MKKIGIITLNGYSNYGNRLQNYAVQEVLKSLGFYVETLLVNVKKIEQEDSKASVINRIVKLKNTSYRDIWQKIDKYFWVITHKKEITMSKLKRKEIFYKFTRNYIKETEFCICDNNIPADLESCYDYFVVGSDQVWNPAYMSGSEIYFLTFAPKAKRIAFSPSFGVSEIPLEYQEDYKKGINGFNYLSVRENDGARLIKELTDRNALVLIDPTLMLDKEKWVSISSKPDNITGKKYILTYFLGSFSTKLKKSIKKISKDNNLEIINLADVRDSKTYKTGPSEFINYINSASVLFTDSFHGCVFSILMGTPFIVFDRIGSQSMYSRINTLLSTFQLESRKAQNIKTNEQIFEVDYSHIPSILDFERKKALDYLKKALNIQEEV